MYGRPERMQARKHFPNKKLWPRSHLLPQVQYSRRFKLFMIATCFKIAFGNWGRYRVYSIHKYGVTVLHITDTLYFFVFQQVEAFFSCGQGLDFFKLSPKVIACLSLAWCVNFFINVNPLLEVAAHREHFGAWGFDWTAGVFSCCSSVSSIYHAPWLADFWCFFHLRRTKNLQIADTPWTNSSALPPWKFQQPVWSKTKLDGLFRHHPDTFRKGHPSATFEVQCSGTFLLFHVVCHRQSIPFCASRWQSDGLELFEFRRIQTNKSVSYILLWQQSAKQFPKKSQAPQKMDHAVFHLFTQPSFEKKIHFEDIHHLHHFKHQILQSNDEILRPCILARVGHYLGKTRLMFQVSLGFSERWNLFILKHKNTWENISTYICESHTWKDEHIKNYGKCLIRWKADQKAQIISWEPFFIPCVLLAFFCFTASHLCQQSSSPAHMAFVARALAREESCQCHNLIPTRSC